MRQSKQGLNFFLRKVAMGNLGHPPLPAGEFDINTELRCPAYRQYRAAVAVREIKIGGLHAKPFPRLRLAIGIIGELPVTHSKARIFTEADSCQPFSQQKFEAMPLLNQPLVTHNFFRLQPGQRLLCQRSGIDIRQRYLPDVNFILRQIHDNFLLPERLAQLQYQKCKPIPYAQCALL